MPAYLANTFAQYYLLQEDWCRLDPQQQVTVLSQALQAVEYSLIDHTGDVPKVKKAGLNVIQSRPKILDLFWETSARFEIFQQVKGLFFDGASEKVLQ
jgi:hypothetical protein